MVNTQQAHDVKTMCYRRRFDVMTSHQDEYNIFLSLCTCCDIVQNYEGYMMFEHGFLLENPSYGAFISLYYMGKSIAE